MYDIYLYTVACLNVVCMANCIRLVIREHLISMYIACNNRTSRDTPAFVNMTGWFLTLVLLSYTALY